MTGQCYPSNQLNAIRCGWAQISFKSIVRERAEITGKLTASFFAVE